MIEMISFKPEEAKVNEQYANWCVVSYRGEGRMGRDGMDITEKHIGIPESIPTFPRFTTHITSK
jgi:hypothetical protein